MQFLVEHQKPGQAKGGVSEIRNNSQTHLLSPDIDTKTFQWIDFRIPYIVVEFIGEEKVVKVGIPVSKEIWIYNGY